MYSVLKHLFFVIAVLAVPNRGYSLDVTFTQTSTTTGTVVVAGDPVTHFAVGYHPGMGFAYLTERVCLKLYLSPNYPVTDVWCSVDSSAPWIAGVHLGPDPSNPAGVPFWDAWRGAVLGKSYNVTKGSYGGPLKLCYGLYGSYVTTFAWCGSSSTGGAVTFLWAAPVDTGPPTPAPACTVSPPSNIDFKMISANEIPSTPLESNMTVSCQADTR
ncbi:MAG: hypothetical protein WCD24_16155, partial [Serratia inhibens]|uniref:hypothetical protein n=1 Tax=Serratia inhibens TaxID=2338073 RepID=UPI003C79BB72